ncbi:hypothetical protein BURPS668_2059 [Burkholderia pseudomallei 668]|nr:hypothetical protein BURPS668_2059 [Burkholderia pseudomallei 668]
MTGGDPAPGRHPDTERLSFFRAARLSDLDQAKAANAPRDPRRDARRASDAAPRARRARVAECRTPSSAPVRPEQLSPPRARRRASRPNARGPAFRRAPPAFVRAICLTPCNLAPNDAGRRAPTRAFS